MKHTPGPWHFTINEAEYIEIRQNQVESFDCEYNPQIGTVHTNIYTKPPMNKKSMEANARLISCAPEMLECMIIEVKIYIMSVGVDEAKKTVMCQLIEKATGLTIEEVLKCTE